MTPFFVFFVAALAGWRLASLFANEDGAFHVFKHFRNWTIRHVAIHRRGFLAKFHFDEGLLCEWCNSVWFGIGITAAWYFLGESVVWLVMPLALSTVAIALKYIIQTLEQVREYFERLNKALTPPEPMKTPEGFQPDWTPEQINRRVLDVAERNKVTA